MLAPRNKQQEPETAVNHKRLLIKFLSLKLQKNNAKKYT